MPAPVITPTPTPPPAPLSTPTSVAPGGNGNLTGAAGGTVGLPSTAPVGAKASNDTGNYVAIGTDNTGKTIWGTDPNPPAPAAPAPTPGAAPFGVNPTTGVPYGDPNSNNPAPAGTVTESTAGQVYGSTGNPQLDAALSEQEQEAAKAAGQPDANDPAVQAQIRAQTLASFQAEIDATNSAYAAQLQQAQVTGQGRLGSTTATEARGGLLGSDFGAAQTDNVNTGNNEIYAGIQAQQAAAIQAILSKSNDTATAAIAAANTARAAGLDSYVKYLQDAQTRTQTNATSAAQAILQAGVDPSTMTQAQLSQYLQNYGISQSDLEKAYTAAKPAFDAAQAAATKAGQTTITSGGEVIGPDGKVVAANPKAPTLPTSAQEFEYAVQNSGYKGSYTDFLKEIANEKNTSPTTVDATTLKANAVKMGAALNAAKGTDGFVSDSVYNQAKSDWIANGGTPGDFDTQFKGFKSTNASASQS